jgi:hypothetical protein
MFRSSINIRKIWLGQKNILHLSYDFNNNLYHFGYLLRIQNV